MPEHTGEAECEAEDKGLEMTVRQCLAQAREVLAGDVTISNASGYLQVLRGVRPYIRRETHEVYLRDYLELMKHCKEPMPGGERKR